MSFHALSLIQAIDILPLLHNYFLDQNIDIETEILYEYLQNSQEWWSKNRYYLGNTSVYIYDPISDKVLQNEEKRFMSPFIFHDVANSAEVASIVNTQRKLLQMNLLATHIDEFMTHIKKKFQSYKRLQVAKIDLLSPDLQESISQRLPCPINIVQLLRNGEIQP
tara:strand:+ start:695 stop:1189 length:495 start_codon:yes stop_codon:yes gene_type:complete